MQWKIKIYIDLASLFLFLLQLFYLWSSYFIDFLFIYSSYFFPLNISILHVKYYNKVINYICHISQNNYGLLSLEVVYTRSSLSGKYSVEATNSEGSASCSCYLDIEGAILSYISADNSGNELILCNVLYICSHLFYFNHYTLKYKNVY